MKFKPGDDLKFTPHQQLALFRAQRNKIKHRFWFFIFGYPLPFQYLFLL
jgi:hypothetical protein